MPLNSLFPAGTRAEQNLVENLTIESLKMYGQDMYYIPRTLVAKDDVLGEDNLSKFKNAYLIETYFDNIDSFGGSGNFMSKFGMVIEEQATLTVARKRWEQLVGKFGTTIIPTRPCEGDLMYFPKTDGLFEIKFVDHQNPFYQLGRLYVYKLKVELFQYSSERMETNIPAIDAFQQANSFDLMDNQLIDSLGAAFGLEDGSGQIDLNGMPRVKRKSEQNDVFNEESKTTLDFNETNPFGDIPLGQ